MADDVFHFFRLNPLHMMDDWDLPDSVFLTGGRIRDKSGAVESTSPAVVCVVVSSLLE